MAPRHVATSMTGVAAASMWVIALGHAAPDAGFFGSAGAVYRWVFPYGVTGPAAWLYLAVAAVMSWWGSLGPDIDQRRSTLGSRWPGRLWRMVAGADAPHHGLTHSTWSYLLFFGLSWLEPLRVLVFFAAAWAIHLWMDGLGVAGRVRWYPFGAYRVVPLGAPKMVQAAGSDDPDDLVPVYRDWLAVPARWHKGWYRTGTRREKLLAGAVVLVHVVLFSAAFALWWSHVAAGV